MPISSDATVPPQIVAALAENFNGATPDRLYDGMVPNFPNASSGANPFAQDLDTQWSWPRIGVGENLTRRPWFTGFRGNTTTQESQGLGTAGGNPTETTAVAKSLQSLGVDGFGVRYTTSAVIGNAAKIDTFSSGFMRREMRPAFACVLRIPTVTTARVWAGLFSSTPEASDDPTTVSGIGFRFTTNAVTGQNAWASYTNAGGGVAGTVGTNTNTVAASTRYELAFFCPTASSVAFFLNGKYFSTHTTRLPGSTTSLDLFVGVTALAASARTMDLIRVAGHSA